MLESPTQDARAVATKDSESESFIAFHLPLVWVLLIGGMPLVFFATPLSIFL